MATEELYRIDLQRFAEPADNDNDMGDDDDPTVDEPDNDDPEDGDAGSDEDNVNFDDLAREYDRKRGQSPAGDGEDDDDDPADPDPDPDREPEPETEPNQAQAQAKAGPTFTQEDVNRIVQERLHRANQAAAQRLASVQALEALYGKPIDQILSDHQEQQIRDYADQHMIDEEEARRIVTERARLAALEAEAEATRKQMAETEARLKYEQVKADYLKTNEHQRDLIRQYESEIDVVAANGNVDFDVAVAFVLGKKVLEGGLLDTVKTSTQKKMIADMQKRQRATPPAGGSVSGAQKDPSAGLTKQELELARIFGVNPKNVAARKRALSKKR